MTLSVADLALVLDRLQDARTLDDLSECLACTTLLLGYEQFAMGHHVALSHERGGVIRMTSYDEEWLAHFARRGYFADDPFQLASTRTALGFAWHEVGRFIELTPRHRQIITEGAAFGLVTGFTVPVHVPGEYQGACSFAARSRDRLHDNSEAFAQLFGLFAFEAARCISGARSNGGSGSVPVLTVRQREAVVLIGRGKTDREIADILGVAPATAHDHVEGARLAYGHAQRPLLVVRALFDGQVAFSDLLQR